VNDDGQNGHYRCFYSIDLAGNLSLNTDGTSAAISGLDTTAPTVSFTPDPASVVPGGTIDITMTTSEATTDFVDGEVTTDMGTLAGFTATSDTVYMVTLTAPASAGTATLTVAADAFTDAVGNGNTANTHAVTVETAVVGMPAITIADGPAVTEGDPGTDNHAVFVLTAGETPTAPFTVDVAVSENDGILFGDFITDGTEQVNFVTGEATATLSVLVVSDNQEEYGNTISATVVAGSGYTLGATVTGTVAVSDDDAGEGTAPPANEVFPALGANGLAFADAGRTTLDLTEGTDTEIHVGASLDSNVPAGRFPPFVAMIVTVSGDLNFLQSGAPTVYTVRAQQANSYTGIVIIPIDDDGTDEADGMLTLTLTTATGHAFGTGQPTVLTVNIADDDDAAVVMPSVSDASADEGDDLMFVINRGNITGRIELAVRPIFGTGQGSAQAEDILPAHRNLRYPNLEVGEQTITVIVTTVTDTLTEPEETFTLRVADDQASGWPTINATGTINANTAPAVAPTVAITGPASFTAGTTTTITLTTSEDTTDLAESDVGITGGTVVAGSFSGTGSDYTVDITATAAGDAVITVAIGAFSNSAGTMNAVAGTLTVTVDAAAPVLPNITLSYAGKFSGGQMCAASSETNKAGVCEGDIIIFTITADPMPTSDLDVRLGRLEAGNFGLNYGVANPSDYVASPNNQNNRTVTILASTDSITHEIPVGNLYGSGNLGGYYVEVVCVNQPSGAGSTGCLTDDTIDTEYTFVATTRANQSAGALTPAQSHCDGGAGGDGDESSECVVHIHPVTAPAIAVAAVTTGPVAEGTNVEFSITADKVPNHYNSDRTALAALPISITIGEVGEVTTAASPVSVNIPAAGSTNTFSVSLTDDSTGWDGANPEVSATVAVSGDTPPPYSRGNPFSVRLLVTDNEMVTVEMGADPAAVTEGGNLMFTVAVTSGVLDVDLELAYTVTTTGTSGTDFTAPSGT
ncbi:MAG: Ig-like domain-containing protein, partial [Pseudohongiellaceae bacterium]